MSSLDCRRQKESTLTCGHTSAPGPRGHTDIRGLLEKLTGAAEAGNPGREFSLTLGDGSRWWIVGSGPAGFIAEQLAAMMLLKQGHPGEGPSPDDRLMFFYEKNADPRRLEPLFSQDPGWTELNHYFFRLSLHSRWHHILGEYDSAKPNSSSHALMFEAMPLVYWESVCRGGLPLHAALLEYQGQRVILAAPGETGKSTCSRRVEPPWRGCCDDEVLVVRSPSGRYLTHPFPTWTDYFWERAENTWQVEDALPLAGIFFFEQAPEDDCVPLEAGRAAAAATYAAEQTMTRFLRYCGAAEAQELRRAMFDNACALVRQVPTFHLRVSLHGRFWENIEAVLGWRQGSPATP